MLYHLYTWLSTDYSIGKFIAVLFLLALVIGLFRIGGANLMRWALVPYALTEWYLMSPGYACSYGGFFPRAQAIAGVCTGAPYQTYLEQNFGIHLWYVQSMYIGLLFFAIWPLISHIRDSLKNERFLEEDRINQRILREESEARFDSVKKIGRM